MAKCSNCDSGAGPFAEGKELVKFVSNVHEGSLKDQPIPGGGLDTKCQGCGERFILKSFVGKCPECEGVHAVSPPRCGDAANIQFAGMGYKLEQ
ncbi:MAG TPA: hypothetical protein ENH70_08985 [Desulfobacteraceae bacterium]|nr:hypothetical protein [Desulfobacteraceae bacterium]